MILEATIRCAQCNKAQTLMVDSIGYRRWKAGTLIQTALPNLNEHEREMLISRTCAECWNKMWKEED